ncbi:hypothetical protein G7061_08400 [Erysipelothrix sp. HDW6B]|uniref:hypothetical protein n=1 Tax=Erysipelothrix sp. HDW6B TaxID=2714929 RepID=UPI00140A2FFB|nr:hypothetical protein [Erysipelothrix sp. HDW6B]QIK86628.1 hypothetical protein G7061_08400 [Erysipelothrix sp. HDW6B]
MPYKKAQHIFKEALEWITDYVEGEIDFDTIVSNYEDRITEPQSDSFDLLLELSSNQSQLLTDIDDLLDQRIITLYDPDEVDMISEYALKTKLKQCLNDYNERN